ncbi:MAG: oligosaccharide flippase family protein [Candidatus Geothermarchaeota archaeon]
MSDGSAKLNLKLLRNFASLLMQQVSTYAIIVLTFGIIARLMSFTEMGIYATIVSTIHLIGACANFGFKKVGIKLIASHAIYGDRVNISRIFWTLTFLSIPFIVSFAFATCYFLEKVVKGILFSVHEKYLFITLLLLFSFKNYLFAGLEALQLFHLETLYYSVGFLVYRLTMIIFLLYGFGIKGVLVAWIIGESLTLILTLRKVVTTYSPLSISFKYTSSIFKDAIPLFLIDSIIAGFEYGDRIASLILGSNVIAYFYIATTSVQLLSSIYGILQSSFLPHFSEMYQLNGQLILRSEVERISKYIFIFVSPLFIISAALSEPILLILAPGYDNAVPIFQVLLISLWITSPLPLLQSVFIASGRTYKMVSVMLISLFIDVTFMLYTYQHIGYMSTGLGRAVLLLLSYTLLLLFAYKDLKIAINVSVYIKTLISGGFCGIVTWVIWSFMKCYLLLPLYALLALLLYTSAIRIMHLISIEDVLPIYNLVVRRKHYKLMVKLISVLTGVKLN